VSALDVGSRRRGHSGSTGHSLRWSIMLVLVGCLVGVVLAFLLLALAVSPAVLLNQLQCRVVFSGILEFLDSLRTLLLMDFETSGKALDAKVVVCSKGRARYVDTIMISSARESHGWRFRDDLQYRTAS
jgi:hypothetical protein